MSALGLVRIDRYYMLLRGVWSVSYSETDCAGVVVIRRTNTTPLGPPYKHPFLAATRAAHCSKLRVLLETVMFTY